MFCIVRSMLCLQSGEAAVVHGIRSAGCRTLADAACTTCGRCCDSTSRWPAAIWTNLVFCVLFQVSLNGDVRVVEEAVLDCCDAFVRRWRHRLEPKGETLW